MDNLQFGQNQQSQYNQQPNNNVQNTSPVQKITPQSYSKSERSNKSGGIFQKIGIYTAIFLLGIGVGGGSTYYLSTSVIPNWENDRVISRVKAITSSNSNFEYVGDDYNPEIVVLDNLGDIRLENSIQAEVYKDAENGDYALIQDDNLVIYSRRSSQVVYQGETPVALVEQLQQEIISGFEEEVSATGVLGDFDSNEFQYQVVEQPAELVAQDPEFYSGVVQGDIVALYEPEDMLFIYDPQSGQIRNSGKISTTINPSLFNE